MPATSCKQCGEQFDQHKGEPFTTEVGLLCRTCSTKGDHECRCRRCRYLRNDPAFAGAIAGARAAAEARYAQ